ncbi:MAG: glycine zipper 2TM domain-containing protein, partial [Rhodoferax sp.]|nr:glycine zipper 2TM domain-containing protein [Rhodoferax sp.]
MRKLNQLAMVLGGLAATAVAMAQDVGRVISSTPVMQQIAVSRQVCSTQQVEVQRPNSGAGALIGAIAGAALGNASGGRRSDRAAASAVGAIGGAILGDHIEGSPEPQVRDVQRCGTQT